MENLCIFEVADRYFVENISEFKEVLSDKVDALKNVDWIHNKGTVKTCQPDETGRKKRCKVGLEYRSKIELSISDVDIIWNEFSVFFEKINTKFNLNIDEYEEEYIEISKQKKILTYLENEYTNDNYICDFYRKKIILFINISLKLNKPIFIFL